MNTMQQLKLEDFLRSNPEEIWAWNEIYDVCSVPKDEQATFRRYINTWWRDGRLPWLAINTKRGRGGGGGLHFAPEPTPDTNPFLTLFALVTQESFRNARVKRLVRELLDKRIVLKATGGRDTFSLKDVAEGGAS